MFNCIQLAMSLALLANLMVSSTAFAKGGFSFIAITGPNLKEEIRTDDPLLTEGFFAFADFSQDKTKAPADPGIGYEITRYYVDGKREIAFDRLHYYPETGFVYYDGIVNGSSEYDGEWYTTKPEIKTAFESTISIASVNSNNQVQPSASTVPAQTKSSIPMPQLIILITAGIALILLFAYRLRQAAVH